MLIPEAHLQTLCGIAQAAGQAVMEVYATNLHAWQKDDASPLTEADLRADAIIRQGLEAAFPGVYILSEESRSGGAHDPHGSFFLVDPLDGTKEFLKRNGEFTVNIAWIHHGEPAAGVVLAPALNEIFFAAAGLGAWKQAGAGARQALRTNPWLDGKPVRVIGSRSHGGVALDAWLARLTLPFTFLAAGSSLKFCRIAEGQADLYPRFGPTCQWDTAAAHCVLAQAGGSVTTMDGQALVYGIERPIRNPEFLAVGNAGLLDAVRVR